MDKNFHFIGIAGDWHCDTGFAHQALATFALNGVTEILHLGDFGLWPGNSGRKFLYKVNKYLASYGQTLRVTEGNHEDYTQIERMVPVPGEPGFIHNPDYPNIWFTVRGTRWEWNGVSFVSLGGANSIDFDTRVEWISWWKGERITLGDVYRTVEGGYADVMLTHDCPAGVDLFGNHRDTNQGWAPTQLRYASESRYALRQAVDGVKPGVLFHGHYHNYYDMVSTLNDGAEDYTLRSVGLGMNGNYKENIGIFWLADKSFELLPIPKGILQQGK